MAKEKHRKHEDNQKTSFMTIYEPGFNSEILKIPPSLLKQGTHQVILSSFCREGRRRWVVELYEFSKNQVFFSNGWEHFVQDHDLHEHDFLLFEFEHGGENLFSVRVFQKNCLEKVYSNLTTTTNQQEPTSTRSKNQHLKTLVSSGKRRDKDIIKRKTKSFSSPNPFFSRLMKDYHVNISYILSIPKSMANNIFSEKRMEVSLKNKEGRSWEVKMKNYNGQIFVIPSGWKSFVMDNSLKVGHVCIFELVSEGKLQVHIF